MISQKDIQSRQTTKGKYTPSTCSENYGLVVKLDDRLGNTPRYVFLEEGEKLMKVPDEVRKCTVFIYYQSHKGRKLAGTGFFVIIPSETEGEGPSFIYLVTAKHVIDRIKGKCIDRQVWVRFNTRDEGVKFASIKIGKWIYHPTDRSVDVAIIPFEPSMHEIDCAPIPITNSVNEDVIKGEEIGIGDEVFLTGLFRSYVGKKRNLPILRIGNIAMMPEEPVPIREFGLVEAYLVESRSIGGLSGSPVFVIVGGFHMRYTETYTEAFPSPAKFYWLGLMHGHWDIDDQHIDIGDEYYQQQLNVGIGIVIPSSKVLEVINQDKLLKQRNKAKKQFSERNMPTLDREKDSQQNDVTKEDSLIDEGVTRNKFHQILDKASQPIKKPESDSEST